MKRLIPVLLVALSTLATGCGDKSSHTPAVVTESFNFEPASAEQLALIKAVQLTGYTIHAQGWATKSLSHSNAYFVSTKIFGQAIENGQVAVWLISGSKSSPGMILSVDSFAKAYTPDIPNTADTAAGNSARNPQARALRDHAEDIL